MIKIDIKQATCGMKLARAVERDDGLTLCSQGVILTSPILEKLREIGVGEVWVEGEEEPGSRPDSEEVSELMAQLEKKFSKVVGDELMLGIKEIFKKRLKTRPIQHWQRLR